MQQLQKPRPGYKLVKFFFGRDEEIPEVWEVADFNDLVYFQEGPGLRTWQFRRIGMKVINVTNLVDGRLDLSLTDRHIDLEEFQKNYSHFAVEENDIVVASSGNSYGKVAVVRKEDLPLMMNTSVIRLRPLHTEFLNGKFLEYFLQSKLFKDQIDIMITGAAQPNFGPVHLKKVKLLKPISIKEQQKIVSILSKIDELIQKTDQVIEQTQRLKKGLMQRLLTQGIGHAKFKKVTLFPRYSDETIPETWLVDRLEDLVTIIDYRGRTPPFSDKGVPHLRSNNIREGNINFDDLNFVSEETYEEYMTRGIPKENDVLFTTEGPLGEVALVPRNFKFSLAQRIMVLRPKDERLLPQFLKYLLLDRKIKIRYHSLATGTTLGGIASKWFTKLLLPHSQDASEQQMIFNYIDRIEQQISQHRNLFLRFESLKKGLMQKLLTGKIRAKV